MSERVRRRDTPRARLNSWNRDLAAAQRAIADDLSVEDARWYLCRRTGRSYDDLVALAAGLGGNTDAFCKAVGYTRLSRGGMLSKYSDYGWWNCFLQWLQLFIPQWEDFFRETVKRLANELTAPGVELNAEEILAVAAKALNIAPEVLIHFAQNREAIETFLEAQRRTLGTIAEAKLWELVMAGDAPTIRWLLPRIKTEQFGDKLPNTDKTQDGRKITIIEGE